MKTTTISPVKGFDLPVRWASKAGVSPDDSVEIIIHPFTVKIADASVSKRTVQLNNESNLSSYLRRCKLSLLCTR